MRFSESEIVEDMLEHIRQAGGEYREWRVGTASTIQDGRFKIQNGAPNALPELAWREAYTTYAAEEVVERLAGFGLQREPETTPNQVAAVRPGKTVFVYRLTAAPRKETLQLRPAA